MSSAVTTLKISLRKLLPVWQRLTLVVRASCTTTTIRLLHTRRDGRSVTAGLAVLGPSPDDGPWRRNERGGGGRAWPAGKSVRCRLKRFTAAKTRRSIQQHGRRDTTNVRARATCPASVRVPTVPASGHVHGGARSHRRRGDGRFCATPLAYTPAPVRLTSRVRRTLGARTAVTPASYTPPPGYLRRAK